MNYEEITRPYKDQPGGLIEAYHAIISKLGYLPKDAIAETAGIFGISCEEAFGVATFYSMFSVNPKGKNIIRVCASAPCHIAGMSEVLDALERELGIQIGQDTDDCKFHLEFTECIGQCQATPAMMINDTPYLNVKPDQIPSILAAY